MGARTPQAKMTDTSVTPLKPAKLRLAVTTTGSGIAKIARHMHNARRPA